ncbi:fibroblast growth factor receptor-like 1 isoform X2 [Clytia hemisphaerica]|uniref:Ig-like domain-containing protein n=1 Tax=Clytia hemisphaerica TaxID=252671 RepID=A0A7M5UXM0_9CNID|eukprot:TCONS_00056170-protein
MEKNRWSTFSSSTFTTNQTLKSVQKKKNCDYHYNERSDKKTASKMCDTMAYTSGPVLYHQREVATEELLRPKIVTPLPLQSSVKVGSEFKLLCLLTGYPTIEINWYLNGDLLVETEDGRIRFDNHQRLLVIRDLKPSDAGSITFHATNKYGEVTCSSHLQVLMTKREKFAHSRYGNYSLNSSNSPKPIRRLLHALNRMKSF